MTPPHPARRPVAALAALGVALSTILLVTGSPAHAHAQVIAQSPKANANLAEAPEKVSLTFSAKPLGLGAVVTVVDPTGRSWAAGEPTMTGATVEQPLAGPLTDGNYQVRWRIVSGDGHPISQSFLFSVGDVSNAPAFPKPSPGAAGATTGPDNDNQGEFALTGAADTPTSAQAAVPRVALFAVAGAVVGLLLFTVGSFTANRPRRLRPQSEGTTP
ncbi:MULTISPECIES: copper resistance CopC family protein [Micromonospora]|uniref:CopC domain-containing protein n=1 Tax=Micromonospora yangpuensis TaxID=683228 RepID=A0A1C6UWL9_9ACTN|nr:copper resistance CopC family protein [Micromonospora yangpuensis]GGM25105.1 copper resistance protein CopC [Micromonospora yangpuensis]SCL58482.1 hypothetical protein GA0070617_3830 [Micromonospora yangpuensis]